MGTKWGLVLPLLVEWRYLVPLVPAGVVAVHSRDLLTRHPVPANYEQVVIEDGRPIPPDVDHIWREVVGERLPALLHLSIPQHGPGLILIWNIQGQAGEVSDGHQGGSAIHAHLLDLVPDSRGQAAELGPPQHGVVVAGHVFETSGTQVVSPIHLGEAVQLHAVLQPDLRSEELKDGGDLEKGGGLDQILQSLVDYLDFGGVDELQDQLQAQDAESLQLHRVLRGLPHPRAVQSSEVVALLNQLLFIHLVGFVIHDDGDDLLG